MRRHGSAATAGPNHRPRFGRCAHLALFSTCALLLFFGLSTMASAAQVFKFKEVFGGPTPPTFLDPTDMAVDQSTGDLLVMDKEAGTISKFNPDGTPDDFSALGTNAIEETPEGPLSFPSNPAEQQIAVDNSGTATDGDIYVTSGSANVIYVFARSGEYLGQLNEAGGESLWEACGVAVDSSGAVYVGDYSVGHLHKYSATATPPVQNADFETTFDEPVAPCTLAVGAGPTAGYLFSANYLGSVFKQDADDGEIKFNVFEGSSTTVEVAPDNGHVLIAHGSEVTEFDASGASQASPLTSLGVGTDIQGIAVDPSGDTYVSRAGAEEVEVWSHVPVPTARVAPPTGVNAGGAVLHGSVDPEGEPVTACKFEYGPTSTTGFASEADCNPPATAIPADVNALEVSAAVSGLQANTTYKFRLSATNANGTETSETLTFTTFGSPQISEIRARDASQTSATLEAKINPSGADTSYRFDWGPTTSYGHSVPADFEPFVGSGTEPVRVIAKVTGLAAGSIYHYRIVAGNGNGTTESPDQIFETLNSCDLPKQRCFELVSPREAGPVASPGNVQRTAELRFQAAPSPGALAYVVESGFPDATRGGEVLYRGTRGSVDWRSTQISAPVLVPSETESPSSNSSQTLALSPDLSCGVEASNQPLTPDASTRPVVEAGGSNLYRRNPDGSYTAITKMTPTDFEEVRKFLSPDEYELADMSEDCGKVVFYTQHIYPGVPGKGEGAPGERESILYEWDEGELRTVGWVPGPDGEVAVAAQPGTGGQNGVMANRSNAVSADGTRVFFSAERQTGPNPAEIGQRAIFVRETNVTRDLSMSETSTPATQVTYQYATNDGSRVYFTAIAGLTTESSGEGIDLYEYDLESEDLTDLSVDADAGGAQVGGFVGASADGTHVYFVARGQLVAERGKTFAQNVTTDTYSLYGVTSGRVEYVGTVRADELLRGEEAVTVSRQEMVTSRVSPDGKYLLFQTGANVTGYESGGPRQAYLYSAADQSTVCVSCRPDGQPSLSGFGPLDSGSRSVTPVHQQASLIVRHGEPSVFFNSRNRLAPGGVEGLNSLYEWSHGQVFAIDTEPPGVNPPDQPFIRVLFAGASADGSDLYLATLNTLTWEDGDERSSVYDARIGGGFPEPPDPPTPCDPAREGSCQGSAAPPATAPGAASATFHGPGNAKPKKSKKRHKKHHRKAHKNKKHQKSQSKQKNHANSNRRAGK